MYIYIYLTHFWTLLSRMTNACSCTSCHSCHFLDIVVAFQKWIHQHSKVAILQSFVQEWSSLLGTYTVFYLLLDWKSNRVVGNNLRVTLNFTLVRNNKEKRTISLVSVKFWVKNCVADRIHVTYILLGD